MAIITFSTVGQELFSLYPQHSLMVTVSSTAIILVSSLVIITMWLLLLLLLYYYGCYDYSYQYDYCFISTISTILRNLQVGSRKERDGVEKLIIGILPHVWALIFVVLRIWGCCGKGWG